MFNWIKNWNDRRKDKKKVVSATYNSHGADTGRISVNEPQPGVDPALIAALHWSRPQEDTPTSARELGDSAPVREVILPTTYSPPSQHEVVGNYVMGQRDSDSSNHRTVPEVVEHTYSAPSVDHHSSYDSGSHYNSDSSSSSYDSGSSSSYDSGSSSFDSGSSW